MSAIFTDKIKLQPTDSQRQGLRSLAGAARHAYNWGLNYWKSEYEAGRKPTGTYVRKEHTRIKAIEFPWTLEQSKHIPQIACYDLHDAYQNFFAGRGNYPKFKSKYQARQGFGIQACDAKVEGKYLKIPKFPAIKIAVPRRLPGKVVGTVRVIVDACGDWWVTLPIRLDPEFKYRHRCESQAAVGIDLGLRDTYTLSNGNKVRLVKRYRVSERKLRRLQKSLARKKRGSRNREKARVRLARCHRTIARKRSYDIHCETSKLVREHRILGIEDLNVRGMQALFGKSLQDANFGEFRRQLQYKATLSGSTVVVADRWFPSSKTCSVCGCVREKLELGERSWVCSHCQTSHDRDVNAAVNLRNVAVRYTETQNICGGVVRLSNDREVVKKLMPWKQKSEVGQKSKTF